MTNIRDEAQRLASAGYPVFACAPNQKRPATAHGFHDATLDADRIDEWWNQWPGANLAIPTDGLLVIDIDGHDNPWLSEQPEKRLELADAPTAKTPRGGLHHYFKQPAGRRFANTASKLAPGVDTRANGGYVLTPPSVVDGKPYTWLQALDCEPEKLPLPPDWLLALLEAGTAGDLESFQLSAAGSGNAIPEGQRNGTLAKLAGCMRRPGMSEPEILAGLLAVNAQRCKPPLAEDEVRTIARSIAKLAPDQVTMALVENHAAQDGLDGFTNGMHRWLTSAEVSASDERVEYIIDDVLPAKQAGIIGGRYKSQKTGTAIEIGVSVATGSQLFNRFNVAKPRPIGLMSAESGLPTLRERGIAVARSKGFDLADCSNLYWSTMAPQLTRIEHLDALRRFIGEKGLEVLMIDPVFLAMAGIADRASNIMLMGETLAPITRMIEETACSVILLHHAKKGRDQFAGQFGPPELGELAFAGWAEWARFWILLAQRREWKPDAGEHFLWLSTGGSAGHAGLWHLDVCEGRRDDPGGRKWETLVVPAGEAIRYEKAEKERAKETADRAKLDGDMRAVVEAAAHFPDGETKTMIRERSELRSERFSRALHRLQDAGAFVDCFVKKPNGRLFDGLKLRPEWIADAGGGGSLAV